MIDDCRRDATAFFYRKGVEMAAFALELRMT
jgi:hypothetical protein